MRKTAYIFTIIFMIGCNSNHTPKPRGFFRIDLPKKEYQKSNLNCPFIFEYGNYAEMDIREEYCHLH